jgi:hypothetical protein
MSELTIITANDVLSWNPCGAYPKSRLREIYGAAGLAPLQVLDLDVPAADRLWTVLRLEVLTARECRELVCDFAEAVLPIWQKKYPANNRPADCIEVARRFARGEATSAELAAARAAAWAAAWDAARDSAWDAAGDAARAAAWAAARAAARATAWDAAWDAAGSAAWDAAGAAAWDAAWDAAGSAAWDAAGAARAAQIEMVRQVLSARKS